MQMIPANQDHDGNRSENADYAYEECNHLVFSLKETAYYKVDRVGLLKQNYVLFLLVCHTPLGETQQKRV